MDINHNPLTRIRGILTRKIHTSKNMRFHVFELSTKKRKITAIYFGFNPPAIDPDKEMIFTGKWQHNQQYGPQFHLRRYESAKEVIERTQCHLEQLYSALDSVH